MAKYLLNNFIVREFVKEALKEDIGYGDITSDYVCSYLRGDETFEVNLKTRVDGIFCGRDVFKTVFDVLSDNEVEVEFFVSDGDKIKKDDILAKIKGNPRYILTGERLALNFVQRMSAIATYTKKFVDIVEAYGVSMADTRKNTPNFRMFEKYAAKIGGARLHRFNLCDCVMLKDNHIALLGGDIKKAVSMVRKENSHAHKIEVECDKIEQVKEALEAEADIIMLDNMNLDEIKKCVTLETLPELAKTGVDIISSSSIITKAGTLDLGFDYL